MLARRQDCQQLILTELHRVIGGKSPADAAAAAARGDGVLLSTDEGKSLWTHSTLDACQYLKCFMNECLRIYPPSTSVAPREVSDSFEASGGGDGVELGGYTLKHKSKVMLNIYGAHHHTKYWHEPGTFDPMRFNESRCVYYGRDRLLMIVYS
jgi:cytochrome P450